MPLLTYRTALMREGCWLHVQNAGMLEQIVLNCLLFVPLGYLLPFTWPERFAGCGATRGVTRVALVAAACSLCVELAQLVLRVGLFELDDILDNALSAALGYALYGRSGRLLSPRPSVTKGLDTLATEATFAGATGMPRPPLERGFPHVRVGKSRL